MNFLNLSQDELHRSGGELTAREIVQQPDVWLAVANLMASDAGPHSFLKPLLSRPEVQIVLTGAGTSACIGECLAPVMTRLFGMRVHAVATTDITAAPDSWLAAATPVLLVSFARSGNSPESLATCALAEQVSSECHHLIITCNREGALYRLGKSRSNAHVVLLPDETNDRGFAMTSSFSSMLLTAALAFNLLTPQAADPLSHWATQVLHAFPGIVPLTRLGLKRVVYLGGGVFKGLAREAALKMLELTDGRIIALSDTPLGFRHGPKTFIDATTLVIVFLSNQRHARRYEIDLLKELRADNIAARIVAVTAGDAPLPTADVVHVPAGSAAADFDLCFPYAVFAQSLALQQSLALGLRADAPNVHGVVNRVVQGVSVYPWNPGK